MIHNLSFTGAGSVKGLRASTMPRKATLPTAATLQRHFDSGENLWTMALDENSRRKGNDKARLRSVLKASSQAKSLLSVFKVRLRRTVQTEVHCHGTGYGCEPSIEFRGEIGSEIKHEWECVGGYEAVVKHFHDELEEQWEHFKMDWEGYSTEDEDYNFDDVPSYDRSYSAYLLAVVPSFYVFKKCVAYGHVAQTDKAAASYFKLLCEEGAKAPPQHAREAADVWLDNRPPNPLRLMLNPELANVVTDKAVAAEVMQGLTQLTLHDLVLTYASQLPNKLAISLVNKVVASVSNAITTRSWSDECAAAVKVWLSSLPVKKALAAAIKIARNVNNPEHSHEAVIAALLRHMVRHHNVPRTDAGVKKLLAMVADDTLRSQCQGEADEMECCPGEGAGQGPGAGQKKRASTESAKSPRPTKRQHVA